MPLESVKRRILRKSFRNLRSDLLDILVACLFVVLAPSVMAQTAGAGVLAGRLTDASGGVVGNAAVKATSVETGQAQSVTTRPDGTYKFDGLPPGNYRLKFEAAGFKTVEIPSITVSTTGTAVPDEKLEVSEKILGDQVNGSPAPAQQENLPNAPSSAAASVSGWGSPADGSRRLSGVAFIPSSSVDQVPWGRDTAD